jgi:hypothetical protein
MKSNAFAPLLLTASLLTGCSSQLLEDAGDIGIPADCRNTTKLFNTFNMRAKSVAWTNATDAKEKTSTLTVELSLENATKWPTPLSNSGNGVLYAIEYSLKGPNGSSYSPKAATGIVQDIHKPIPLEEMAEGKLVFAAPKANYLLTIERKFSDTAVPGKPEEHISSCRIFSTESTTAKRSTLRATSGVY